MKTKHERSTNVMSKLVQLYILQNFIIKKGEREGKKVFLNFLYRFSEPHIMLLIYKASSTMFKLLESNAELFSNELHKQYSDNKSCHDELVFHSIHNTLFYSTRGFKVICRIAR